MESGDQWEVTIFDNTLHIKPIDDLQPHEGIGCWCKPTLDDAGAWVHHSKDRREDYETRRKKPA